MQNAGTVAPLKSSPGRFRTKALTFRHSRKEDPPSSYDVITVTSRLIEIKYLGLENLGWKRQLNMKRFT